MFQSRLRARVGELKPVYYRETCVDTRRVGSHSWLSMRKKLRIQRRKFWITRGRLMLRQQFVNDTTHLLIKLKETSVQDLLNIVTMTIREDKTPIEVSTILSTYSQLNSLLSSMTNTQLKIVDVFGIREIFSEEFWANIIQASRKEQNKERDILHQIWSIHDKLRIFVSFAPPIIALLDQRDEKLEKVSRYVNFRNAEISNITIVLPEESDQNSDISRVAKCIDSVERLYKVICRIENEGRTDLIFSSCDSGSDKSFDFLGISKCVSEFRQLILELWDRIVFNRHRQLDKSFDTLVNGMSVLEKLSRLRDEQKIDPETHELMKRDLISGLRSFVSAGAIIPEMNETHRENPRSIAQSEMVLLEAPEKQNPTKINPRKTGRKVKSQK
jgi:hypothetical protein